jgi:hypothetical protein
MNDLLPVLVLMAFAAVIFFAFGFALGHDYGYKKGREDTLDDMGPTYSDLLAHFSTGPKQYKNLDWSGDADVETFGP